MNSFSQVDSTLKEILEVIKPLREDWITRFKIIDELREVVQSMESLRGATVEPFGSFVSNLFTRWGDLDISIELPYGSYVLSAGKKRKQNLLGELLKALRQRGGWLRLQFIPHARVPILKIESRLQNISCDISIDNLQGQLKSKFLFWLSEIDGRYREIVLLVKEWAKANGINNPKGGTFNSYSLSLLVIFHFQTCVPAIFPPLKDIYPGNVADDLTGVRVEAENRIARVCSTNIERFRSSRTLNRSSLAELFISFIAKFSDINLKASEMGICPFTGQWEYIESNKRWLPRTYAIFIEDPFEQRENAARAVNKSQLTRISETFETTRRRLISANLNQSNLLSTLVMPQISRRILKPSSNYTSYNGGHYQNSRPQVAVHSPRQQQQQQQQQHQYRNVRPPTSLMQQHAQKNTPSTSNFQSRYQSTRLESRARPQQYQAQIRTPAVSQIQPQTQRAVAGSHPVTYYNQQHQNQIRTPSGSQILPQTQRAVAGSDPGNGEPVTKYYNEGKIWKPKSDN